MSPRHGTPVILVALAMAGTLYVLDSWLPAQITREHAKITARQKLPQTALTPASKPEGVPQELLDYIREQRQKAQSVSDHYEMTEAVAELDLPDQAEGQEILKDKFGRFFKTKIEAHQANEFAVSEGLEDHVRFWVQIFGAYDKNHVVFYHPDDVSLVYSVLDFSDLKNMGGTGDSIRQQMIAEERARLATMIRKVLTWVKKPLVQENELAKNGFSKEESRLYHLLHERQANLDLNAASLVKNLNYRTGFSHRIRKALVQSGRYLPEMQRIFRERGLPVELTMIPFIESTFHLQAYSRSQAAGVWQFIPQTGSRYLRIDEFVDERYDPILATYAAASHLAHEYSFLKSWALTVNAYNTGPGRMMDAVEKLKTSDIATIIKKYDGAGYGFDSRNYYPEFLAMLHVFNNRDEYFDDVETLPVEEYEYLAMPATTNLRNLFQMADVETEILAQMNPGLKPEVLDGRKALPKGYLLKVPPLLKQNVLLAAKELYHLKLPVEDFDTEVSYVPPKRDFRIVSEFN